MLWQPQETAWNRADVPAQTLLGIHVDERMLVSWAEMNDLAEGVFSLVELEDLYKRQRADEQQKEL